MRVIPVVTLTLLGSGVLFYFGGVLEKRVSSQPSRTALLLIAIILATPGLLFVFYYTHLFDNAGWFYSLRILPFTEFLPAGLGLLAG